MYNDEVELITPSLSEDLLGNQIETNESVTVLCKKKSISQNEFYNAAVNGMKPSISLVVHTYEYSGQVKLSFDGIEYNVIRAYEESFEEIELVCERAMSNE